MEKGNRQWFYIFFVRLYFCLGDRRRSFARVYLVLFMLLCMAMAATAFCLFALHYSHINFCLSFFKPNCNDVDGQQLIPFALFSI